MLSKGKQPVFLLVFACLLAWVAPSVAMAAGNKCGGYDVAVANVEDSLLIRDVSDTKGAVIGYLPAAAGVLVRDMDEAWTKVQSGGVTGYVKTEFLAFGEQADALKSVYGVAGAVASWDGVKVFADYTDTTSVIGMIDAGEGYAVLGSTANWVEVQLSDGSVGYLAAEDVQMTTVLDTAVPMDATFQMPAEEMADGDGSGGTGDGSDAIDGSDGYYDGTDGTGSSGDGSGYWDDSADSGYASGSGYESGYWDGGTDSGYASDSGYGNDGYYDGTDGTGSSGDGSGYWDGGTNSGYASGSGYESSYWDGSTDSGYASSSGDGSDSYDGGTGDASGSGGSSSGGVAYAGTTQSDLDLLAALIYCEAGNQSAEGKVAVGQVVLNRVGDSNFADNIHDVIYQSGQFTPASTGWLDQVIGNAPQDCYDAAQAALNGEGTVGGSLYFNGGTGQGLQIGDHQFY